MMKLKKIPVAKHDKHAEMVMPNMMPPYLNLRADQVPEIKLWEVGETYRLVVDIKQTSKNEEKDGHISGGFDVVAYKYLPAKSMDEMTDEEFEAMEGEMREKAHV